VRAELRELVMKRKLQIFVSSTFEDMKDERQAAVDAMLRAGHIPAGMELFAAGDESQLKTIRRWIDDSDVFMLVLGGRYGSIEPKSGKSYIELEYDYAARKKKPLFAAINSKEYLEAKVKSDGISAIETTHGVLLEAFRERVTQKICRFFKDATELKLIIFESLSNFERDEGLSGWIRGSDVLDPKATLEEVSRLQAENASLRDQVAALQAFNVLSETGRIGVNLSLSEDAKSLLVTAKNADGRILYIRHTGGANLQTGNVEFIVPPGGPREEARWKAALQELLEQRLIEQLGTRGETFRVTKMGYDLADQLESTVSKPEA
jgi:hypothetical protein